MGFMGDMLPQPVNADKPRTEAAAKAAYVKWVEVIFMGTPKLLNNLYAGLGCVGFKKLTSYQVFDDGLDKITVPAVPACHGALGSMIVLNAFEASKLAKAACKAGQTCATNQALSAFENCLKNGIQPA